MSARGEDIEIFAIAFFWELVIRRVCVIILFTLGFCKCVSRDKSPAAYKHLCFLKVTHHKVCYIGADEQAIPEKKSL